MENDDLQVMPHWPYEEKFNPEQDSIDAYVTEGDQRYIGTFISPRGINYQLRNSGQGHLVIGNSIIIPHENISDLEGTITKQWEEIREYFIPS
tara:strand:- start:743 stop:1021 length:279 start_codon:yes stop_codon:yes gene_type:complete